VPNSSCGGRALILIQTVRKKINTVSVCACVSQVLANIAVVYTVLLSVH